MTWTVRQAHELTRGRKRAAPHAWYHVKGFRFPWPICRRCGLVWLKNSVSHKAAKQACEVYEDET